MVGGAKKPTPKSPTPRMKMGLFPSGSISTKPKPKTPKKTPVDYEKLGFVRGKSIIGSKSQVFKGTAHHTTSGQLKKDIVKNDRGHYVSKLKRSAGINKFLFEPDKYAAFRKCVRYTAKDMKDLRKKGKCKSNYSGKHSTWNSIPKTKKNVKK